MESAVIGEIGNNTFDHNFTFTKDSPRGVLTPGDEIILDFNEVKVLTPSWADEFIRGVKSTYINTENSSVKATSPSASLSALAAASLAKKPRFVYAEGDLIQGP